MLSNLLNILNISTFSQSFCSALIDFLRRNDLPVVVLDLYEVHAFRQIEQGILVALDVLKFLQFATHNIVDGQVANHLIIVSHGNILSGRIWINGEVGLGEALGFCRCTAQHQGKNK